MPSHHRYLSSASPSLRYGTETLGKGGVGTDGPRRAFPGLTVGTTQWYNHCVGIERGHQYLEFVYTSVFERSRKKLLDEEAMRRLELALVEQPQRGRVERAIGGVRKVRVGVPGMGKRGGARVLYQYDGKRNTIYFLLAFAKSEQETTTGEQRARISELVKRLKQGEE